MLKNKEKLTKNIRHINYKKMQTAVCIFYQEVLKPRHFNRVMLNYSNLTLYGGEQTYINETK